MTEKLLDRLMEELLYRLLELQFMSRGRHNLYLSNLHYPRELIHATVCLSICRPLHLKSDDWTLHAPLGKI